jgi:glycosyltransferase involved in cell wall biosynthesis
MTVSAAKNGHGGLRIGFDFRFLQASCRHSAGGGLGGAGVYTQGLWKAMARLFPETEFVALVDHGDIPARLEELVALAPRHEFMPFGLAGRGPIFSRLDRSSHSWLVRALESEFNIGLPREIAGLDILHILNQSPAPAGSCPTVMTVYDLISLGAGVPAQQSWLEKMHRRYLARVGKADRLVCISAATRDDAEHYLNDCAEKTTVIYPGIDLEIFKPGEASKAEVRKKFGLSSNFFVHVGVCYGRKNPRGLIEAMKIAANACDENFVLALVGPYQVNKAAGQAIMGMARDFGIAEKVVILGDVSDADLALLYRNALALVFPSLYEGFGLPVAEALACGAPCITSNTSSLPEVAGDLGVLVDPANAAQIAEAMVAVARKGKNERVQIEGPRWAQKFSWDKAATAYMEVYRALVYGDGRKNKT